MVREQNFWKILADTLSRELAEAKSEIERLTRERDERESTLASLCDCVNTFAREEGASENHQYLSLSGVKEALSLVVYAQRKKLSTKIEEIELTRGAMAADDERLRKSAARVGIVCGCDAAEEMADEIERLRAALQEIAAFDDSADADLDDIAVNSIAIAKIALKGMTPIQVISTNWCQQKREGIDVELSKL